MSDETERPQPPPEAALIEAARRTGPLSIRAAATAALISEGRWRQITRGYVAVGDGYHVPVNVDSQKVIETLARMANAVGVPVEEMDETGRFDIAARMQELAEARKVRPPSDMTAMSNEALLSELARLLSELARRLNVDVPATSYGHVPVDVLAAVEVEETAPEVAQATVRNQRAAPRRSKDRTGSEADGAPANTH